MRMNGAGTGQNGSGQNDLVNADDDRPFLRFAGVRKRFGGAQALAGVSLDVRRGECHALIGENGAGKSTLGKILAGIHVPDAGRIEIEGRARAFRSPRDAARAGVAMVHQELAFCPDLSVAENLSMGRIPGRAGFISRRAMNDRAVELLGRVGLDMDVSRPVRSLSTAQEQMVQIAAALGAGARILVFDEPTSSLSQADAERLFSLIAGLKAQGVTLIYVSHRMEEIFRLCDRISVLRDGHYVGTLERQDATDEKLIQMMIGRPVEKSRRMPGALREGPARLIVEGLRSPGRFRDVALSVSPGEILGIAGLVGAGRSEVARAIFGLDCEASGSIAIDGVPLPIGSVRNAMRSGIGLVPEDRKREGLVLPLSCLFNFSLPNLDRLSAKGFMRHRRERRDAESFFGRLRVKTAGLDAPAMSLSGGNQQKIVIAKWLARELKALILDEPTRGVDVGAKQAIHDLVIDLAGQGLAVILISSELPELLALATRILVMREGRIVGQVAREEATQEGLMRLMAGAQARGPGSG